MLVPLLAVGSLPLQPSAPASPPLAVHAVAFVVDQERVVPWPVVKELLAAVNELIDAAAPGGLVTLSVTELGAPVPPGPLQVKVYVYEPAVLIVPVLVPVLEVPTCPFQPSDPVPPVAVQEVALLLVQASDAACPV